jgi:hypothetical protein
MKPRKVTLTLEITTDVSIGVLRKTRSAILEVNGQPIGQVSVQQATASVVQPIPTAKPPKKGASKK